MYNWPTANISKNSTNIYSKIQSHSKIITAKLFPKPYALSGAPWSPLAEQGPS